ncbi:hypothetical protein GQ457_04G007200 [Hibiscus cannabinus]
MVEQIRDRMSEAAPFTVMVIMEACTIALTILAKTALTGGLSPFVFVVYTNAIGSSLLLPFSFLYHRGERTQQSLITFPLLLRIVFLGLTGIAISQNLAFLGLSYSSPIVVCATGLLLPSISFLLSIVLRTAKLDWGSSGCQAKLIATLISIAGIIVVELYRGPFIRTSPVSLAHPLQLIPKHFVFYSTPDRWVLGGLLLAAANFSISVWNTIQMGTVKHYPQVMKVASFYSLVGTIQCLVFSLCMERDLEAWKLKHKRDLLLIIVTGTFGSIIRSNVHLACTRMKGPFYVPMFKPFGILFATIFGTSFFTNSLQYGSVIGTMIVGTGYYALMWGQIREEELRKEHDVGKVEDVSDLKAPLLQVQEEDMVEHTRDVAAFTVMVIMEACTIALTILAKTALNGGLSPFVFVVYTNAVASSLLLPFSFLYHRRERTQQSLFPFPLLRMFFLGLTGIPVSQNLAFLGLTYSSPIVVCATGLLLPSISFLLSIILRTTKLDWGSSGCQAKLIGTLISITGIIVVELYGGPFIPTSPVSLAHPLQLIPTHFVFYSTPDRWVLGGLLLAAANFSISILNIIQVGTVKQYPQVMKVASFYSLVGTIQCLVFSLCMERDINAWKLKHKRDLLLIIVTGTFGSIIRSNVHLACTRMKGPFYVPMFKPFGILFATIFGTSFFTNSLQYGSVIGTVIVATGYYALMWGQIREKVNDVSNLEAPLLGWKSSAPKSCPLLCPH